MDQEAGPDQLLERLRHSLPVRLDALGEFWIDDEPVTHPRILALLRAGLDVDQGRAIVRLGTQWVYLKLADTPLRVVGISHSDGGLWVHLDDGRRVCLDPETLAETQGRGLRVIVPSAPTGSPLEARFTNAGLMQLIRFIEIDAQDAMWLAHAGRLWPLAMDAEYHPRTVRP